MTAELEGGEWSTSTPRPHFTLGKDPVSVVQEAGWAPGPVWAGGKSRAHRDSISDRPARSPVAIPTGLPAPRAYKNYNKIMWHPVGFYSSVMSEYSLQYGRSNR
jgi:hypothetical protein